MARTYSSGMEFVCNQCGRTFRKRPSRRPKFCSIACYSEWTSSPVEERFLRNLGEATDRGCILWTSTKSHSGYGLISLNDGTGNRLLTHRLAWEIANGPIPEGICVLHECDNRLCVNADHLFLGTRGDNNRDKYSKGREARGEKCRQSHLVEADILAIRSAWARGGKSQRELGAEFGAGQQTIHKIVSRATWSHVR